MAYLGNHISSHTAEDNVLIVAVDPGTPKDDRRAARKELRSRTLEVAANASKRAAKATGSMIGEALHGYREATSNSESLTLEPAKPELEAQPSTPNEESNFFPDTVPAWMTTDETVSDEQRV